MLKILSRLFKKKTPAKIPIAKPTQRTLTIMAQKPMPGKPPLSFRSLTLSKLPVGRPIASKTAYPGISALGSSRVALPKATTLLPLAQPIMVEAESYEPAFPLEEEIQDLFEIEDEFEEEVEEEEYEEEEEEY